MTFLPLPDEPDEQAAANTLNASTTDNAKTHFLMLSLPLC
jgi:hypothetical protein